MSALVEGESATSETGEIPMARVFAGFPVALLVAGRNTPAIETGGPLTL
jgi:hypothetical protein